MTSIKNAFNSKLSQIRKFININPIYLSGFSAFFTIYFITLLNCLYDGQNHDNYLLKIGLLILQSLIFGFFYTLILKWLVNTKLKGSNILSAISQIHLPFLWLWLYPLHLKIGIISINKFLLIIIGIFIMVPLIKLIYTYRSKIRFS